MNIGTPFAVFIIIYTESNHKHKRVKNDVMRKVLSATSKEKSRHSVHFSIRPPSSEERGIRLNIDKHSERIEKGKRKFWQNGKSRLFNDNLYVKANPINPISGPPSANINSSIYDGSFAVFI